MKDDSGLKQLGVVRKREMRRSDALQRAFGQLIERWHHMNLERQPALTPASPKQAVSAVMSDPMAALCLAPCQHTRFDVEFDDLAPGLGAQQVAFVNLRMLGTGRDRSRARQMGEIATLTTP